MIVYLPPGYESSRRRRYPVFYLLHGFPGRPAAFLQTVRMGVLVDDLVALGRMRPVILVMPFGSTGTFTDKEWVNGTRQNQGWESFVAHDLVRAIDARYRTIPTGAGRAIGGLSEGGYGALNIALHHAGEFRVVESWSGYQQADNIPSIFGRDRVLLAYNSPSVYLPIVARQLRARGVFVWSTQARKTHCWARTSLSTGNSQSIASRMPSSSIAAATPGLSGAQTPRRPCSSPPPASPMARLARIGELLAVGLLALLVIISTSGVLYLAEPHTRGWGRPLVYALPLDELAHHAALPLVVFVVAWAAAGALLGLLSRTARIERLTAGLVFALLTGAWLFAATGISLEVVRQIPTGDAFETAARVSAVYLAAGLVGLSCALLARRGTMAHRRAPVIIAVFVAASGVFDVASAVTPAIGSRLHWIENATPNAVPRLANALVVPAGLALIVLARGLYRRRRRAWQLTLVFVIAAAALHILKGLDYEEAAANLLLAVVLVARRHDFEGRGDPRIRGHVLARAGLFFAAIYTYAALALWINRVSIDRPYSLGFALGQTSRFLLGIDRGNAEHVSGHFGDWFPTSVFVLGLAAVFSLLWIWLAPWRYRLSQQARERRQAAELVARFGSDTLAPFALRADKSYFFSEDERAFLAYRVVAGIAVISGDPVGPDEAVEPLLARFLAFAHERDWRIAMLGASERHLSSYETLRLHAVYHGNEAVVDPSAFSLEGRAVRKVRQSVSRLEREGYRPSILYAGEIEEELRAELEEIAAIWQDDEPTRGFTMELDELFRLEGNDAIFVIGYGPTGNPEGFLHFAISHPGRALSLSSMPRLRTTPNGFNEWLVVESLRWARDHGYGRVSLNFAPFAALFEAEEATLSRLQRLQRRALHRLKGHFQLDNLLAFNQKFFPSWEKRFVVYEHAADLPRVGLAGLAAEGYLPLTRSAR